MSKKDKEIEDLGLTPELFDGRHQVIPIISGGDDAIEQIAIPEVMPILTLRSSVIFPGAITPITVGREKSIALVRAVCSEPCCSATAMSKRPPPTICIRSVRQPAY